MKKHGKFWPKSASRWTLALALAGLCACSRTQRVKAGQEFQMGQFKARVEGVSVYTRAHQGVPLEVEILLRCDGGNRFDRMDFGEAVSRKGKLTFKTSGGWSDRVWLLRRGDDARQFAIQANPPLGSKGYVLTIGNPYGKPDKYEVDLGR